MILRKRSQNTEEHLQHEPNIKIKCLYTSIRTQSPLIIVWGWVGEEGHGRRSIKEYVKTCEGKVGADYCDCGDSFMYVQTVFKP